MMHCPLCFNFPNFLSCCLFSQNYNILDSSVIKMVPMARSRKDVSFSSSSSFVLYMFVVDLARIACKFADFDKQKY